MEENLVLQKSLREIDGAWRDEMIQL